MPAAEPEFTVLTKTATGIAGFDEITGGGLPQNRTTLLMGSPGAGKTILALQALVNGAKLRAIRPGWQGAQPGRDRARTGDQPRARAGDAG